MWDVGWEKACTELPNQHLCPPRPHNRCSLSIPFRIHTRKKVAGQNSIPIIHLMSKFHKTMLFFFPPTSFKLSVNAQTPVVSGFAFFLLESYFSGSCRVSINDNWHLITSFPISTKALRFQSIWPVCSVHTDTLASLTLSGKGMVHHNANLMNLWLWLLQIKRKTTISWWALSRSTATDWLQQSPVYYETVFTGPKIWKFPSITST